MTTRPVSFTGAFLFIKLSIQDYPFTPRLSPRTI